MTAAMRLSPEPIWSFAPDGSVIDIADPRPEVVCFLEMANVLSKIARFDGRNPGIALSVAQHCVMGAQAIINEGGSPADGALFLLHDGHEYIVGDQSRPSLELYSSASCRYYGEERMIDAVAICKSAWDEVIYYAAGLPGPEAWTKKQAERVKTMDGRMCRAEAIALFGPRAGEQLVNWKPPKLSDAIKPWAPMKAEEEFRKLAYRLIGEGRVIGQAATAAAARSSR
ncbi:hypothetical protein GOB91_30195 [Sinorhizobium meliloti]|nr:hypothetical protein [Sinorhizobium meliloti]MDW9729643.1 hypothetical protein [Sinorhizobium meliloti]